MISSSAGKHLGAVSVAALLAFAGSALDPGRAEAQISGQPQAPSDSAAPAGPSSAIEEIVVTATRRKDTTANTAMAITAFSGAQLENAGVTSVKNIAKIEPSVTVQSFGVTQSQVIIRGISSTVGATSGAYLDEAPLISAYHTDIRGDGTPGLQYQDVERFEVLKGPQGTLFGSGSMAGTLRVITNKPDLTAYAGKIEAGAAGVDGGDALVNGSFVVNIPIVNDVFGVRFVGYGENGGGFIDQNLQGRKIDDVNDDHMKGGRITALFKPIDALSITASISYQDVDVDGPQNWTLGAGPYNNVEPSTNPFHDAYLLYNLTGEYQIDDIGSISAIWTHGQRRMLQAYDSSGKNCLLGGLCVPYFDALSYVTALNYTDWTAEARFSSKFDGPFQLVAGAYYQDESSTFEGIAVYDDPNGQAACYTITECDTLGLRKPGSNFTPAGIQNYAEYGTIDALTVRQYALYAQADYKILDNLTVTGGIRFFAARLSDTSFDSQDLAPGPTTPCNWVFGCITPRSISYQGVTDEYKTTYNLALLYKVTPDISVYARAASGFRVGGLNPDFFSAAAFGDHSVPLDFKPDSLWDYEIGAKAYFLDHRLRVDLSYYHIDWSDQQVEALSSGAFPYILNAGRTATDGVELDMTYRVTPEFTITPSVTYVNAVLAHPLPGSVAAAGFAGNVGDRLPLVPHWSGTISGQYSHPLDDTFVAYVISSATYRSGSANGFNATDNFYTKLTPYTLVDLKLGLTWDRYDVNFFIENLTNRSAEDGLYADTDGVRVFSPRPRTIGVHASASF